MDIDSLYLAIDGDQVGKRLEQLILVSDISSVVTLSNAITNQFSELQQLLEEAGLEITLAAGDMLIGFGESNKVRQASRLLKSTTVSLSAGVGRDIRAAYLALRYAKSLGGNQAVEAGEARGIDGFDTLAFQKLCSFS